MARVVQTEKMVKKKNKTKIIVIICIIVALVGIGTFVGIKVLKKKPTKEKQNVVILDKIDDYGYTLANNDSDYFASEYKKLKDILNENDIDTEKYVAQVAKMFIIDLYSLGTKVNKYDVGGKEYYISDKSIMFEQKVMDTIYESILDNTYGDRNQELPIVKSVDIKSVEETDYKLGDKKVDAYLVKAEWSYEKSMGYDYQGSLVLCKDGSVNWSVVDFQPTLNPEYK